MKDLTAEADELFKKIVAGNQITYYDMRLQAHFRARYVLAFFCAMVVNAVIIFLSFCAGILLCVKWDGPMWVKILLVFAGINYIPFLCSTYIGYKGERFMKQMPSFFSVRSEWWKK